ncbi:MAG: flagellar basal body P-ring protein FlgI [Bryobacterales bacterium]|nr:flagellar basal body P-ring protein FlgI [Bryobacterales bacterium]
MFRKLLLFLCASAAARMPVPGAVRVKELASLEGVRENQLIGYGLVVGLAGTGDRRQTAFPAQSLTNMLERMGVTVPPTAISVKNTAAVMVTATLPAFSQSGARIDVTAASMGDASNLQGGLLLLTSLRGANGQVYAVAQGPVVTGGFSAGRGGNSQGVNHPTVGRVAGGGLVERSPPSVAPPSVVKLQLRRPDFTTASRMAEALNKRFGAERAPVARAENPALVSVDTPESYRTKQVDFIAAIEAVSVDADRVAKIVINERTGTIVLGRDVRISPMAVLHGNLSVEIQTSFAVSQPSALAGGKTAIVPEVTVSAREEKARNVVLKEGATVEDLVKALVSIGSTPRDVIAILQSLRSAGALEAELELI